MHQEGYDGQHLVIHGFHLLDKLMWTENGGQVIGK